MRFKMERVLIKMKKFKIMFVTGDFKYAVGQRNDIYFIQELSKLVDLTLCYLSGNIKDVMKKLGVSPDFILLNDLYCSPPITGLSDINIPKGIIVHDTHWEIEYRRQFINNNNIDYVFSIYRDPFYKTYPELKEKMYWHPHFINPKIFKDYGEPKSIDYLLMGMINDYYPLRRKILEVMKNEPGFIYHKHPGYVQLKAREFESAFVEERYAKEINRSKIFLTDDSKVHYPLMKYYEVLACKTLLLAPTSKEIEDLGFIPGVNFVDIDEVNFLDKARYYLNHEKERNEIAQRGYDMVHTKHTVSKRVEEFIDLLKRSI